MLRFSQITHTISEAEDAAIIGAFTMNVKDNKMHEEINMHPIKSTHELWELDDICSLAEEGRLAPEDVALEGTGAADPGSAAAKKSVSHKRGLRQDLAA